MNKPLTDVLPELKGRLQATYADFLSKAASHERENVEGILQKAHEGAVHLLNRSHPKPHSHEFAHAWSLLNEDVPMLAETASEKQIPYVSHDGHIVGFGKYELLDPGYVESVIEWLAHFWDRADFGNDPATITIPDNVKIALAGDWGTGNWRADAPSQKVADAIWAHAPEFTIHLGDVYYAGTGTQEAQNLLPLWPRGSLASLTLNSNHEMYNGGHGYFDVTLKSEVFKVQNGASYFALENAHWIVVGLDSVYGASEAGGYMHGQLNQPQLDFLGGIRKRAAISGKRVIVLSHHPGLGLTGEPCDPLWTQVTQALGGTLAYWYWGHVHAGVAYKVQGGVLGRCCGHGAVPHGAAPELDGNDSYMWRESASADDPQIPLRILNGFVLLELQGAMLKESFIDENNRLRWSGS
jgi:hypothetical protein